MRTRNEQGSNMGEGDDRMTVQHGQDLLPVIAQLENSDDGAVSNRGAIGKYQIMPGTARGYGFDPARLNEPAYNEQVAAHVLNDLWQKYRGNPVDVLAAYNSGEGTTNRWIANGRRNTLPPETSAYLTRASGYVAFNGQPLQAPTPGDGSSARATQPQPVAAPGRDQLQHYQDAGFSSQELGLYKATETKKLLDAGFKPQEIDAYWGDTDPDPSHLDRRFSENFAKVGQENAPKIASNPLETIAAGWDRSVAGLRANQSLPKTELGPDAGFAGATLAGMAQMAGDAPSMLIGAMTGGPIGAAGASVVAGPEMAPVGLVGGALFGAGALPQAEREIMMDYYGRGEIATSGDFLKMAAGSLWRTAKSGLTVAATGPVGGKVESLVAPALERAAAPLAANLLKGTANVTAQAATMTGLDSAFAGKLPDAADFGAAAVTMLGMHVAGTLVGSTSAPRIELTEQGKVLRDNLEELYRQHGIPPWLAVKAAREDPTLMQELLGQDVNGQPSFPQFRTLMHEPDPYQAPPETNIVNIGDQTHYKTFQEYFSANNLENDYTAVRILNDMPPTNTNEQNVVGELRQQGGEWNIINPANDAKGHSFSSREDAIAFAKEHSLGLFEEAPARKDTGGSGGEPPKPPGGGLEIIPPTPNPRIDLDPTMRLDERMLNEIASEFIGEPRRTNEDLDPAYHYRQWISELGDARAVDKLLAEQGFDRATQVGLEDMFRQTYASNARTGYFIFKGGLDPITLEGTRAPPVMDAVKLARENGGNLHDWMNYMVAKRAIEKTGQGRETGHTLTLDQLHDLVAFGERKYEAATQHLQRSLDSVLDYGRDSGVFSQEQVDAMRRDNPIYISFRRLMGDAETVPGPKGGRRGFRVREPVNLFEGDDRRIQNPLIATIDNINQIVRMADRNRAIGSAIALAEQHGLTNGLGLLRLTAREAPAPYATLAEPGSDTFRPYDVNDQAAYEPFLAMRASRFGGFRDNQFMFLRNGQFEVWEATNPALARLMRGADSPGDANLAMKIASGVAGFQRAGIVDAPDFPVRNVFRDQITAFVLDPLHPPPFVTWIKGAFEVFGKGEKYYEWLANGGGGMSLIEMDRNTLHRDMQRIFDETGTWNSMWNVVRHPIEAAQILSAKMDESSRVGYFMHAQEQGSSALKAGTMSRKAYLDFVEKATSNIANGMARTTPFFRPNILGLKQNWEAVATPGNAAKVVALGIAAITVPQVALYFLNEQTDKYLPENEQYANQPRYYKDGLYIFPPVGSIRLRLPVPPGPLGVIFSSMPIRFLDWLRKDDPDAFRQLGQTVLAQVVPPLIPSVVLPFVEHLTNYSFFSGRPLVPSSMEKASGPMQYTPNTTEIAKRVSQFVGKVGVDMSPVHMENYVREWSGSLGMAALKTLSAPLKADGKPWEITDTPFVQSFLLRNPGMTAQPIQDFYAEKDKLDTLVADKRLALKRAGVGAGNDAELEAAVAGAVNTRPIEDTARTLTTQYSMIQAITNQPTVTLAEAQSGKQGMTKEEKLRAIDGAYSNMIETAKFGLAAARAIRQSAKGP